MALGELVLEDNGQITGIRILSTDASGTTVELSLTLTGTIRGVAQTTMWTYNTTTRADGSIFGQGRGVLTTADGDVVHLVGRASDQSGGPGSPTHYRGAIHFQTSSAKFAKLNGVAGVFI